MSCKKCGQVDNGQTGEYPCKECGLPLVHDILTKDEKIKEVMDLVAAREEAIRRSISREIAGCGFSYELADYSGRQLNAIEAKLRQLINDDATLEAKIKEFPRLGPKIEVPVERGYYPYLPRAK